MSKRPYRTANLVIPNELHERKVALEVTWITVVERGVEALEKEMLYGPESKRI